MSPRLYASRLLTSTGSGVRVHATEGPPFSRALYVALTLALAYPSYFLCSTDQYSAYWIWWLSGCVTQCFPFWLWPSTCLLDSFTDLLNFSWFIWLSLCLYSMPLDQVLIECMLPPKAPNGGCSTCIVVKMRQPQIKTCFVKLFGGDGGAIQLCWGAELALIGWVIDVSDIAWCLIDLKGVWHAHISFR